VVEWIKAAVRSGIVVGGENAHRTNRLTAKQTSSEDS